MSSPNPQFKGPKKYEHGRHSPFVLSALSITGQWVTIYSRARPGSRANKVFTDDEQLLHLRQGFTDKAKGFQMFDGDFLFAYIGRNAVDRTFKNALYHWTLQAGWKTGPIANLPTVASTPQWKFGSEGSTLYLHIKNAAGWLPKIWGWDRPDEKSTITYSLEEQIARLQQQFADGGHGKCRFKPSEVIQAHIAYRVGGSVQNSICYFTPQTNWQQGTKPYQAYNSAIDEDLPEMRGKLWVCAPDKRSETIRPNVHLRRQFSRFCAAFAEQWPAAVDRYCDPESGEIPLIVMEAYFWANEAKIKKGTFPAINMARIYFGGDPRYLLARMDSGKIYDPRCFSWPPPDFFNSLNLS